MAFGWRVFIMEETWERTTAPSKAQPPSDFPDAGRAKAFPSEELEGGQATHVTAVTA
jgi:hypothetical protein